MGQRARLFMKMRTDGYAQRDSVSFMCVCLCERECVCMLNAVVRVF